MKNRTKLPNVYLGVLLALMYVPILLVIVYSFNESKTSAVWAGFSWKWYEQLFRDEDLFEALKNSIVLGVLSSCAAAVIGTLGAYGMSKVKFPLKGAVEYVSTLPIMIPEIILGMVFMAFFSLLGLPFGMTTLVIAHTDVYKRQPLEELCRRLSARGKEGREDVFSTITREDVESWAKLFQPPDPEELAGKYPQG